MVSVGIWQISYSEDCLNYQNLNDVERYIYVGDNNSMEVEAIWNFKLLMCTRFNLHLKDTFVVLHLDEI